MTRSHLSQTALLSLLALLAATVGCVNLDAREATKSTKAPMVMSPKAMTKATFANNGSSFKSKLKNLLPKRPTKVQIADAPMADDDPTRLDYDPGEIGPELYISAARLSEQTGHYEAAIKQYAAALNADGRSRNALIGLARLNHRIGKNDEAIRHYHEALSYYPNDAVIMNDLGLCLARNGQMQKSAEVLQNAVAAAPDRDMYLHNLATVLVELNRTDEAVARLETRLGPATAHFRVGYLLNQAGRLQESSAHLEQALAYNPGLKQARQILDEQVPLISALPARQRQQAVTEMQPVAQQFNGGVAPPPTEQSQFQQPQLQQPQFQQPQFQQPPFQQPQFQQPQFQQATQATRAMRLPPQL